MRVLTSEEMAKSVSCEKTSFFNKTYVQTSEFAKEIIVS